MREQIFSSFSSFLKIKPEITKCQALTDNFKPRKQKHEDKLKINSYLEQTLFSLFFRYNQNCSHYVV